MMKVALYDYIPRRMAHRASFAQQDRSRMILGFKDGRNVYTRWAASAMAKALAMAQLTEVTIVCVPASTRYSHIRRWKLFTEMLCKQTGAVNGFDRVQVLGSRKKAHITGEYELAHNIKHYVHIDDAYFQGRKVLVIDDIYTTGQSSSAFISALQAAGADVVGAMFLAKTKLFRRIKQY